MDRFILNVLDPNYFDFKEDLLIPLQNKGKKEQARIPKGSASAAEFSKKSIAQSKMDKSKASGMNQTNGGESQKQLNPSATVASKLNASIGESMNQSK